MTHIAESVVDTLLEVKKGPTMKASAVMTRHLYCQR